MSPPSRRLQTKPVITCLKTFLISYSLIFWFTGVILLAVGVWGKVSLESYLSLASNTSTNAPYVLIGTGAIIVIFGLFGCFATCRGSPWMLKLYAMFLTLVFLAELVAGISGFVFRHEIKAELNDVYQKAVKNYNSTGTSSQAVDSIQRTLKCCGVHNYTSWADTEYFKQKGIPSSCCIQPGNCTTENLKDLKLAETVVYKQSRVKLCSSISTNNLTMMQICQDTYCNKHSLLNVMNRFMAAANNMDETIMVPSLLRDVPLNEQDEASIPHNNNNGPTCPSKQRDMYEHYLLLKSIKNEMEWGLLKREMAGGASFVEMAVKQEEQQQQQQQQVNGGTTEDGTDLESQFHFHLRGLFGVLSKLTVQADHLTNRYKREIGGSSLLR
ncbi:hypothetical protein NFI96_009037 [Prochilodus magdalenae]|nr:hypothetical protein NFI96_009037 [Prochilodus magdalenae]